MALPKAKRPEYNTTIPSTGKKIKYQPFTVREEKVLILAAESRDPEEIANAVSNILNACVTSPSDFDARKLALFDIEYLFLKMRAKSAGEKLTVRVTDPDDLEFSTETELNIDSIKVVKTKGHTDLIKIDENTSVKMRYPDISFFEDGVDTGNMEAMAKVISRCVASIVVEDEVFSKPDISDDEVTEWLDGLTQDKYKEVLSFFETSPKLTHTITLKNTRTGLDFTVRLEGLADFF